MFVESTTCVSLTTCCCRTKGRRGGRSLLLIPWCKSVNAKHNTHTQKQPHLSLEKNTWVFAAWTLQKLGLLDEIFRGQVLLFWQKKAVRAHVWIMFTASHDWRSFDLSIGQLQASISLIGHPHKDDYHKQLIAIPFCLKFCRGLLGTLLFTYECFVWIFVLLS